jgi:DNA-binding NarL/FixJ family response regulator
MTDRTQTTALQDAGTSGDSPARSTNTATAHIVALSSDVMLTVRLEAIARGLNCSVEVVSGIQGMRPAFTRQGVDLVLLDLADAAFSVDAACTIIREQAPQAKIVAFYPHVRTELAAAATTSGCDVVIPRSRLLSNPAEALRGVLDTRGQRGPAAREAGGDA